MTKLILSVEFLTSTFIIIRVSILNQERIPSPSGKLWSWSTIWHILHNEVYIGQRVWNKHDYSTGKKKKSQDEWIVSANAQPAIIDRDTFNAVKAKSTERNYSEGAFKSIGPSMYLLRGILVCPDCGIRMVTGSNSKSSRGKTRYYHCGTYHRKGSKACNRNTIYKDQIESAVFNCLIREFSILSYPGSVEEEIAKFNEYKQCDIIFQLSRIEDDITRTRRRLDSASQESTSNQGNKFFDDYVKQLNTDLEELCKQKEFLTNEKVKPVLEANILQLIRDDLRSFASSIRTKSPEEQHSILKSYIQEIIYDKVSSSFKLTYRIKNSELPDIILLEKSLYFNLD